MVGFTVPGGLTTMMSTLVIELAPSLAVALLLLGLTSIALSRLFTRRELPRLGLMGQSFAFITACAVTVIVCGLAPARIISHDIQAWVLTILIIITPVVILLRVMWIWLRRRHFKFSLRAILVSSIVLCLLSAHMAAIRQFHFYERQVHVYESNFIGPFDLSMPARGWEGLDAGSLENVIRPLGSWLWAVFQWAAYHGQFLTVAIWAGFVAVLLHFKIKRTQRTATGVPLSCRDRTAALFQSLGRPSLTLSALTLIMYLAVTPIVVKLAEQDFQREIAFARNPKAHWTKVEKAVRKVRSDPLIMGHLRKAFREKTLDVGKTSRDNN